MTDFKIEIKNIDQLAAAFKKAPQIATKHLNDAIKKSLYLIEEKAKPETPVDLNFLRGAGYETSFGTLKGELKNTAPYAVFVHEGTRPHFPPLDDIKPWADRHGIPPFLVARAISKKGTKGKPFFKDAIEKSEAEINRIFDDALIDITNEIFS
ncbi:MAG: hypothetical protein E6R04_11900 [Spirochaetes bacterium]|nr:MAG: hypothetical protein E6R04_11900 [Spirochaetota bacterium]